MGLEGDSLAPFVVTPMANVLRALECAPSRAGAKYACLQIRCELPILTLLRHAAWRAWGLMTCCWTSAAATAA